MVGCGPQLRCRNWRMTRFRLSRFMPSFGTPAALSRDAGEEAADSTASGHSSPHAVLSAAATPASRERTAGCRKRAWTRITRSASSANCGIEPGGRPPFLAGSSCLIPAAEETPTDAPTLPSPACGGGQGGVQADRWVAISGGWD